MVRNRIFLIFSIFTLLITSPLYGDGLSFMSEENGGLKWISGAYFDFGASVLEDGNGDKNFYAKIGFFPVFKIGDHELALDLTTYFDANGDVRSEDWDSASDLIRKIQYYKYKTPEDFFSLSLGMVEKLNFGNGVIMRNYSNSIRYPLTDRKVGATFMWNSGYDDKAIFFIDDISDPSLYGLRGFIQPMTI